MKSGYSIPRGRRGGAARGADRAPLGFQINFLADGGSGDVAHGGGWNATSISFVYPHTKKSQLQSYDIKEERDIKKELTA